MKKFLKGFTYAFNGLKYAAVTQLNFRVHLVAMLTAITLGLYFHLSANEWCWLAFAIAFVLITELLNTAIEILVDLVSPGYNIKAGHIKDVSAAAVLLSAIFAVVVGGIIFIPKLFF
ncbi:diacylglycerol kinase family protein [Mucilaginibacter sp. RS28]|uniref:Diacylglycerol kinase family protein n=1 Tax=Mucilaginibacter straminoryzae TaxID=2932774 RepID=A0A9X1WZC1_9SPHI|nr:diacylglycerol kinase family protein [Mucilaginibacter straminoryzae]MCJ8208422.1 diacylglycerol kinase family protein [Mucilaginibacter straminoryzae]